MMPGAQGCLDLFSGWQLPLWLPRAAFSDQMGWERDLGVPMGGALNEMAEESGHTDLKQRTRNLVWVLVLSPAKGYSNNYNKNNVILFRMVRIVSFRAVIFY